jgi:hypothetical protein
MLMPGSHFFVVVEAPLLKWLPMHVVPPAAVYEWQLQRILRNYVHSDCLQAALCARLLLCLYHMTAASYVARFDLVSGAWQLLGDALQRPCNVMLCTR